MSLFLMVEIKAFRLVLFLSSLESLDHKYGSIYLIECFPYLTVQNRGILKLFPFQSRYVAPFSSNIFCMQIGVSLCLTLYTSITYIHTLLGFPKYCQIL